MHRDLDNERNQIWAEAVVRWKTGGAAAPRTRAGGSLAGAGKPSRATPVGGHDRGLLSRRIPEDWLDWSLDRRRMYWGGHMQITGSSIERDQICAAEIWCELLERGRSDMTQRNAREDQCDFKQFAGWEYMKTPRFLDQPTEIREDLSELKLQIRQNQLQFYNYTCYSLHFKV